MIIVTGATGQLGRLVVQRLLDRVPAAQIGVSVRDPAKAQDLSDRGVRVRRGDFMDAASLAGAFEGASQVLLVSSGATDGTTLQQHRTAIDAARAAGAGRIVYTSHMGASPTSRFPPMRNHAATEDMLRSSGVPFTSLRNGFYAASAIMLMGEGLKGGDVVAPADGPVSWTAHDDLAEAAAVALADEGKLDGITPPLTGSAAVDLAGLASIASDLLGRPVRRVTVPDDPFRAGLAARGRPEPALDLFMGLYAASRAGEFAAVDPTLARLLGRPTQSVRDVLAAHVGG